MQWRGYRDVQIVSSRITDLLAGAPSVGSTGSDPMRSRTSRSRSRAATTPTTRWPPSGSSGSPIRTCASRRAGTSSLHTPATVVATGDAARHGRRSPLRSRSRSCRGRPRPPIQPSEPGAVRPRRGSRSRSTACRSVVGAPFLAPGVCPGCSSGVEHRRHNRGQRATWAPRRARGRASVALRPA